MRKIIPFFLGLLGIYSLATAQIGLTNTEYLETLKNGTTYVVCPGVNSEGMAPYREAFIKNWTFSELSFITPKEKIQYRRPGNSFISFGGYSKHVTMTTQIGDNPFNTITTESDLTHPQMQLVLFVTPPFNSTQDSVLEIDVAFLELFVDYKTLKILTYLTIQDFSGGGRIRGWGPGVLSNKIQQLTALLEEGKVNKYYKPDTEKAQLVHLKTESLLIPDYCLIYFNSRTGDESKRIDLEELMMDYDYPYELVSTEELNNRILTGEQAYYLQYVKIVSNKYIEVVNSTTGAIIYSDAVNVSYNIKTQNLKSISKAVRRQKE